MKNALLKFQLSSDECELLLGFEDASSITILAENMGRDQTVVSRLFKRIAEKYPVLEKRAGKWALTDLGRRINEASREAITHQAVVLNQHSVFRIGANREFAARVLAADLIAIQELFPNVEISIKVFEQGSEQALLNGMVDVSLDCDRPFSPEIAYKLVIDEPIVAVASKGFMKRHRATIINGSELDLPHLLCDRLHPSRILTLSESQLNITARFNDIATVRTACLQGIGWALLPRYAVKTELDSGLLVPLKKKLYGKSRYGVWWPRGRKHLHLQVEKLIRWLQSREL